MTTPEKAKGSQYERDVVKYLQQHGFPLAERRFGAGQQNDTGDIRGVEGLTIECKNLARITLASIMDEVVSEQSNARTTFGAAFIKRRRSGVESSYVVMTLEQFTELFLDYVEHGVRNPG